MIAFITGTLIEVAPPTVCVETAGLGYEIDVPMSTLYKLPGVGEKIRLHTHLSIRDDAHVLYGFISADERTAFRSLIKVTGVGARTALAILSGLSVAELVNAIEMQETGRLVKVPGIGKKTAERLLLELRDKLGHLAGADTAQAMPDRHQDDALNALLALGYSATESRKALARLPDNLGVSDSIREALKILSKV